MISDGRELRTEYRKHFAKTVVMALILLVAVLILFIYGLTLSQGSIGFSEAYHLLMDYLGVDDRSEYMRNLRSNDYMTWLKTYEIVELNIPRLISGFAVGATLAICGAIMQSILKNPLADPFTTGISSGALLGVSLSIAMGVSIIPGLTGDTATISNAFIFALIPTAAIIFITLFKKNITPSMMILIGIAVMYIFSACSSLIRYNADPDSAQEIFEWTLGSIAGQSYGGAGLLVVVAAISFVVGMVIPRTLNAMTAGDNMATTLGINVRFFRGACLVFVALVTAFCVSYTGTIGFIGLVCPHIARILVGANNKFVIPASAMIGMALLVFSDCIARNILMAGLPVGAVTALIGSPIFIYLLVRQKKSSW